MRSAVRLGAGAGFTIDAVTCVDDHRSWSEPEVSSTYRLVLVRRGHFRRMADGLPADLDPTIAYLAIPGEEEHFAHPAGGDLCTSISLTSTLWHTLITPSLTPITLVRPSAATPTPAIPSPDTTARHASTTQPTAPATDLRPAEPRRSAAIAPRDSAPSRGPAGPPLDPAASAPVPELRAAGSRRSAAIAPRDSAPSRGPAGPPLDPAASPPVPATALPAAIGTGRAPADDPAAPGGIPHASEARRAAAGSGSDAAVSATSASVPPVFAGVPHNAEAPRTVSGLGGDSPGAARESSVAPRPASGDAARSPRARHGRGVGTRTVPSTFYVDARVDLAHRRVLLAGRTGDVAYALTESLISLAATALAARPETSSRSTKAVVEAAREAIAANHPAAEGLVPLAECLDVSPYQLSRAFTRELGVSLTHYRNRVRVAAALDRLEAGEPSLAVLAADLGYADQAHLTRTIRRHVGHTPTTLRRLLTQGGTPNAP